MVISLLCPMTLFINAINKKHVTRNFMRTPSRSSLINQKFDVFSRLPPEVLLLILRNIPYHVRPQLDMFTSVVSSLVPNNLVPWILLLSQLRSFVHPGVVQPPKFCTSASPSVRACHPLHRGRMRTILSHLAEFSLVAAPGPILAFTQSSRAVCSSHTT